MGYRAGYTQRICGVSERYYVEDETATEMAYQAVQNMQQHIEKIDDIDCIIAASGTMEQAIPCNAAKLLARLNLPCPIPAFDINMTCLGSLAALDIAATLIQSRRYRKILIYASDIASVGVTWAQPHISGIFGDGAACVIVERSDNDQGSSILASEFHTISEGVAHCEIVGGGTATHPTHHSSMEDYAKLCQFKMQGKQVYKLAASVLPEFCDKLLSDAQLSMSDIDWVVPHQASPSALQKIEKKLAIPKERMLNIVATHGNQIAASLLTAYHYLLKTKPVKAGDKILLLGTGAGLSVGGMVIEY